jgi:hypothetical protein
LLLGIKRGLVLLQEGHAVAVADPETSVVRGKKCTNLHDGMITCQFEERFKLQSIEAIKTCGGANPEKAVCSLRKRIYSTAETRILIPQGMAHLFDRSTGVRPGGISSHGKK